MNDKRISQSGITLIALIITIIVMLILVAVTVSTVVNSGLFGHTKDATGKWAAEQAKEANIGNDNYIKDTVNQNKGNQTNPDKEPDKEPDSKPDRTGLSVGDYIDYIPDTASNYMGLGTSKSERAGSTSNPAAGIPQDKTLTWRVMSINDDGSVDIVSTAPTATRIYFGGAIGYNNGVLLLNDLCKTQYSNSTLGVTARSIDLEDIEKKFNSAGIDARNGYANTDSNTQYGESKIYSSDYSNAPDIYDHVGKTTEEESKDYYTSPTTAKYSPKGTLTVKQTGCYNFSVRASYFDDTEFYKLIFGTDTAYWLASRYADCGATSANFGLRFVNSIGGLSGYHIFYSNGNSSTSYFGVRPVVTLGADIQISAEGGTADAPRTLSK